MAKGDSWSLREFAEIHGGKKGKMLQVGNLPGTDFVTIKTADNSCFLAFARNSSFATGTVQDVKATLRAEQLDVLEGVTSEGKVCFTIVEHNDALEDFDF